MAISVPDGFPEPSAEFRTWAAELKITGVRAGPPPRIMAGRSSYLPGETINLSLEIVFEGYDDDRQTVRFRDKSGAALDRSIR
ncbi:MAG: hypothetical protein EXS37_01825 [Opitutus sp.]|nr:hypothetical protein [Opitutus sp.]